ncbi:uncharacterized protein MYCFIDRAFT_179774 [Pseudocercospora fijiensis CIRAD86]|uniref:Uncharacterized protein n=1 Tax=Pseudocercospora fijiensis (strain CIRAD86) TaxID=383855 RepID=M3AJ64_PSEFD|nr:uncharacterized protein MYCFIDRAFT_179774 [Pseudocercospora fijiensis CIRAD86]EME77522.1 hypothetical protein MYCFIDRAFT_179774 [Pseudocercospora fijiensis CIRAD86]
MNPTKIETASETSPSPRYGRRGAVPSARVDLFVQGDGMFALRVGCGGVGVRVEEGGVMRGTGGAGGQRLSRSSLLAWPPQSEMNLPSDDRPSDDKPEDGSGARQVVSSHTLMPDFHTSLARSLWMEIRQSKNDCSEDSDYGSNGRRSKERLSRIVKDAIVRPSHQGFTLARVMGSSKGRKIHITDWRQQAEEALDRANLAAQKSTQNDEAGL